MWSDLRAVSFDLDDTLWHVEPVLVEAESALVGWIAERYPRLAALYTAQTSRALRLSVASAHPERAHDLSWVRTQALRRLALEAGYPAEVAEEAFAVFHAARHGVVPYPDVAAALDTLSGALSLYALSNGNADVHRTPLAPYFRAGVSAGDAGAAKPDPRIFAHLLKVAAVSAAEVVHVGDDPVTDVAGARAAGWRTVWVNRGARPWPSHLARADAEVADLAELVALLGVGHAA